MINFIKLLGLSLFLIACANKEVNSNKKVANSPYPPEKSITVHSGQVTGNVAGAAEAATRAKRAAGY